MKIKVFFKVLSLVVLTSAISYSTYAACGVNPDPFKNTGHCRPSPEGNHQCYVSGEGLDCSHTIGFGGLD